VEHRGVIYPGEHAAIVEPAVWDQVNTELRARRRDPVEARMPQNALLAGLLFCASCHRPMVATYTAKSGRRYRYYVCQAARQKGWATCPTKSVPAGVIEDSVLAQLRGMANRPGERFEIPIGPSAESTRCNLVRALVESIQYDGTTGAVSLAIKDRQHED
jgi:site-specific DNA recombinase